MARPTALMVALPNQGQVTTITMKSVLALAADCFQANIPFVLATHEFSDIVMSRNALMSKFLSDKTLSHCLWLDSDIAFHPGTVWRMADFDVDWTVATYPRKRMDWDRLRAGFEAEAELPDARKTPTEELLSQTWRYTHQPGGFDGQPFVPRSRDGFVTIAGCGAGFMLMTRAVPERLVETGEAKALPRMNREVDGLNIVYHNFFGHLVSPSGDYLYAEDQSVCLRWARTGGEIWMDTRAEIGHIGAHAWVGRYKDVLGGTD